MSYSSPKTIAIVAKREVQVASRSKAIMLSLGIVAVLMVVGIVAAAWFTGKDDDNGKPQLGLVGVEKEFIDAPSSSNAEDSKGTDSPSGVDARTIDSR